MSQNECEKGSDSKNRKSDDVKTKLNEVLAAKFADEEFKYSEIDSEKPATFNVLETGNKKSVSSGSPVSSVSSSSSASSGSSFHREQPENAVDKEFKPAIRKANVAVIYSGEHIGHDSKELGMKSPESSDRLTLAIGYLEARKIFGDERCNLISDFDKAAEEDLLRVHAKSYVDFIRSYAQNGGGFLGDSTYVTKNSYDILRLSIGGAIKAADIVLSGSYSYAYALIRPPGHHANDIKYAGYCLFNNAAVLTRYLQQVKHVSKVMIIDWDAHAGNGTSDLFYSDPSVMTVSIHRDPHTFYPRTGFTSQVGKGKGKGYNVNIEMPKGSGNEEYKLAFSEIVLPLIKRFSPGFVICCSGFDGYYQEKNIQMSLTSEGYYQMVRSIASVIPNNLVILLEGGYHKFIGQLSYAVICALLGEPNPIEDGRKLTNHERNLQKKTFEEAKQKIAEVKKVFFLPD